ncbi:MAG: PmoA family protein [Pirellulaceae bacterium]
MPIPFPRCRIVPLPSQEIALEVDGERRLGWHGGTTAPRPFFYPVIGPSGLEVTRMGHPGAPNHDHHQSVWFAHQKVLGIDFWSNQSSARIRQKSWLVYEDRDTYARLAVRLGWYDGHDPAALIEQDVFLTLWPLEDRELLLDVQTTLTPRAEQLELGTTNFGLLAVRMAKHLSVHFGGGTIRDSEKRQGETQIFGESARWVDYSGPVPENTFGVKREGITFFDHPDNPGYPTHWHVREDGWMGASFCMKQNRLLKSAAPLRLHYGLFVHGNSPIEAIEEVRRKFVGLPVVSVRRGTRKHEQFEITESL